MIKTATRYTAVQIILLAADDLMAQGASEFTEWDLTIAAWNREKTRFGLRGYAQTYPDHKRVMMEIMGKKPQNPLHMGLLDKLRPNHYRLTPLGRSEAARLRSDPNSQPIRKREIGMPPVPLDHYDAVLSFINHAAFHKWREDPDEPKRFADVAEFLGFDPRDKAASQERFRQVGKMVRAAISWCNKNDVAYLTKNPNRLHPPIHFRDIADLFNFLKALQYRFPQLGDLE